MRTILCFGDSNTWGYAPGTAGDRLPLDVRIPGLLQALLGSEYRVLEEGLNGRMSVWDDPMSPGRNAKRQLPFLLESHMPLDLVSIMLGTNDLKAYMNLDPYAIAQAQGVLIDLVDAAKCGTGGARPAILLIAPPLVVESPTPFGHKFDGAIPKSQALAGAYREIAREKNCLFLDAGSLVRTSVRDGIHLDPDSHRKLAEAMAGAIKRALE